MNVAMAFYLEKRDGFARTGKLEFNGEFVETPYLIRYSLTEGSDEGSLSSLLKVIERNICKAPYPLKAIDDALYSRLKCEGDISVISGLWRRGRIDRSVLDIPKFQQKPVYVTAAATPVTVPFLIYMGADFIDNILAIKKALEDVIFFPLYEIEADEIEADEEELRRDLREKIEGRIEHNTKILEEEVEKCRILIEREELRNYVESVVKLDPELTALLRLSDGVEQRVFPRFKKSRCLFSSLESSNRFEVKYFLNRSLECYNAKGDVVLILPCTATKPYLISPTHREIRRRVDVNVEEIIVSSPLVVPREFELLYPACNYDTPVTGQWSDEEIGFVSGWLTKFLEKGGFEVVVGHVSGGYRKVVEKAVNNAGCEVVWTAENNILSRNSIENLKKALRDVSGVEPLYRRVFNSMLSYQFGITLDSFGDVRIRGKYPHLEAYGEKSKLGRVDMRYGCVDIYGEIALRLVDDRNYCIKIADFEPKSKVFASGVEEVFGEVRPNDIVAFYNSSIYGVGIAVMSGEEMIYSDKGLAFRVKRVYKK